MARRKKIEIPVIPLRGITIFPVMSFSFDIGRDKSIKALEVADEGKKKILLVAQKDPKTDEPCFDDLYTIGVIVDLKQTAHISIEMIRALGESEKKVKILSIIDRGTYLAAEYEDYEDAAFEANEYTEALARTITELYEEYAKLAMNQSPDSIYSVLTDGEIHSLCNKVASFIGVKYEIKQQVLELTDAYEKAAYVIEVLERENYVLEIQKGIYSKVKSSVDSRQKEYYLKEQIKAIEAELGEKADKSEAEKYREKITALKLPKESHEKLMNDIDRFAKMSSHSSDYSVMCGYFDNILELPWNKKTKETYDVAKAEKILKRDHYGLEKVKERVVEYVAVRSRTDKSAAPVLCFVGPPGTGKTSVAKSIAEALSRNYVRVSLGGVRDEAEIRGHRKTYVGAMPGRIISAIKQAKSSNPLILFDEIDKLSSDFRGDPSSALLEVFDAEQNFSFRDHYLEISFDLSDIILICTANSVDTIPPALKDRLEIIEVSGYTEEEKLCIAKQFLIKRQIKKNGLKLSQLKFEDSAIRAIISNYTRESGVRQLERCIASVCRKVVMVNVKEGGKASKARVISEEKLKDLLGLPKYRFDKALSEPAVGIARGLAFTPNGGDTLSVEVNTMKGTGKFELTGNMGEVMKESAKAAISYIRAHADKFHLSEKFYKDTDIHIHVPEGAVPKDGPSAGITMAAAMVSALTDKPVANDVAMTGEITIRGNVLPVGGLKEKILAAKRAGITKIAAPYENKRDIEEIPESIREGLTFFYANHIEQVLDIVIEKEEN